MGFRAADGNYEIFFDSDIYLSIDAADKLRQSRGSGGAASQTHVGMGTCLVRPNIFGTFMGVLKLKCIQVER